MTETLPQLSFKEVLQLRPVRRLWIAQLVSIFGDYLAVFAMFSIVTFNLHGTPFQVSMILVAYLLPMAVISPFAGVFVDKWDVKWTMIGSDLIRAVMVTLLLIKHDLFAIYGTLVLLSCISSFFIPAQSVAVRTVTPLHGLVAANGLMSQAMQLSQIVAPAAMALVIAWLGPNACFAFDCASFFFSAGMVMTVAIGRESAAGLAAASVLRSMMEGLKFIVSHAALSFVIVSMTAGMFAVRCFGSLISIYVRDILDGNAELFGTLNALIGVGMVAGALLMPRLTRMASAQHLVAYGLAGMGFGVFMTAMFAAVPPAAAAMLAVGFFAAFVMVCAQTLIQQETPPELLGRVSSTLMSLLAIAQVLALLGAGPVAEAAGVLNLYFLSAAALVAVGAVGYWKLETKRAVAARR
jgi:DHA3 family macrolide efflux protein-like MFS transporter